MEGHETYTPFLFNLDMITEDYVSFETAKLLKENGFDWETHRSYLVNDNVFIPGDINDVPQRKDAIRIPTLQMAMKWLREVHKIIIELHYSFNHWYTLISEKQPLGTFVHTSINYNSYEEACEEAIKYCLYNLI